MEQSTGFVDTCFLRHIFHFKKEIYGLKHAAEVWYHELSTFLLSCGFHKSHADNSLFIYRVDVVIILFIFLYMWTILSSLVIIMFSWISLLFVLHLDSLLKTLSCYNIFLEWKLSQFWWFVSFTKSLHFGHARSILHDGGKRGGYSYVFRINASSRGFTIRGYQAIQQATGRLQYLGFTRPEISFAVNKLSQYMQTLMVVHW